MTLRALVFDVDGTLADTEETHRQAFNDAFVRFGLAWEWTNSMYRDLLRVSGGKERIVHYADLLALAEPEKSRLRACAPAIHAEKTRVYAELVADGRCPLRPGVARLIDAARRENLQLAIASTTSPANVDALFARQLRGARFDAIACGDHVARKKPAPDIYALALSMLGRSAGECVAIEDSANGVRAAKGAGLYTVVTPSPWTTGEAFDEADLLLPHLGDASRPLPEPFASTVGAPWLSIGALRERLADAAREAPVG